MMIKVNGQKVEKEVAVEEGIKILIDKWDDELVNDEEYGWVIDPDILCDPEYLKDNTRDWSSSLMRKAVKATESLALANYCFHKNYDKEAYQKYNKKAMKTLQQISVLNPKYVEILFNYFTAFGKGAKIESFYADDIVGMELFNEDNAVLSLCDIATSDTFSFPHPESEKAGKVVAVDTCSRPALLMWSPADDEEEGYWYGIEGRFTIK